MYRVQVNDKTWRRHADQLRPKGNCEMSSEGEAQVEDNSIIEIPDTITETEAPRSHQIPTPTTSTANHN